MPRFGQATVSGQHVLSWCAQGNLFSGQATVVGWPGRTVFGPGLCGVVKRIVLAKRMCLVGSAAGQGLISTIDELPGPKAHLARTGLVDARRRPRPAASQDDGVGRVARHSSFAISSRAGATDGLTHIPGKLAHSHASRHEGWQETSPALDTIPAT